MFKKFTMYFLFTLVSTLLFTTSAFAEASSDQSMEKEKLSIPNWFVEVSQDKILNTKDKNNYHFFHNNGKQFDKIKLDNLIDGGIDYSETDMDIIGVGVYELNGKTYTDFIFSNFTEESLDDIKNIAVGRALKTKERAEKAEIAEKDASTFTVSNTINSTPYYDSYTWRVYDGSYLAGIFTSNVDYNRLGTAYINGRNASVWDIKFFNQSDPQNSYQTREIITRFSVGEYPTSQKLRSYGPYTTPNNSSASVSLSGFMPSVGWSFNTYSSSVTDDSSLSSGYGRWIFKAALGSNTAKYSHVMEPGARVTNDLGNIYFKTTHNLDYYKNLNSNPVLNTGGVLRNFSDM